MSKIDKQIFELFCKLSNEQKDDFIRVVQQMARENLALKKEETNKCQNT